LRLDIALRMHDKHKLLPVYLRLMDRDNKTDEENVIAFTVAPTLGRWQDLRDLGDKIMQKTKTLDNFHSAALQRQDIPDYSILYQLADEQEENTSMDDIFWLFFKIKSIKIKLNEVEAPSEEEEKKIRDGFKDVGPDGYKAMPAHDNRLARVGAFAQMVSPSAFPIPLAGPATRNTIRLLGYADVNAENPQRQTETYELKKENNTTDSKSDKEKISFWTGKYEVKQEDLNKNSKQKPVLKIKILFHCKMELEELSSDEIQLI